MRVFLMALLVGLSQTVAGEIASAQSGRAQTAWPPAAIAESSQRIVAKPIRKPTTLTFPQHQFRRYERSNSTSQVQRTQAATSPELPTSPTLVSPVIELPPRESQTAEQLAKERVWEQIRQRERMRADARRARIAYRKAIGYSPSRPTIRGSIVQPRVIYLPRNPHGFYRR